MAARDHDFDPDDNFASGFVEHDDGEGLDEADGDVEVLAWQWLLRINPGDEEAAAQQLQAFRDTLGGDEAPEAVRDALEAATDWRSSFRIAEDARTTLIDAIDTLAERVRADIDWDVEDPTDDEALEDTPTMSLLQTAFDQLRVAGYTLWVWETGDATVAGVMAPREDDEGMRVLAHALGLELRPAG